MPEGENCPPQILLSKNCEGPAVTLLSFSSLLPHACGVSGTLAGTPFPTLALYCNLFPHAVLAAGSHYVHEQLQSSSSPELFCQDESLLSDLHNML